MASIRKYKDKWRVEVYVCGVRKSAVWATKKEAMAWAIQVESELREPTERTFDSLADEYLRRVTRHKAGALWEERRIAALREHFAGPLREIDAPDIARWRDSRLEAVSASTVVREANLLRHMFSVARDEWRWIDHSPFRGVKLPKENPPRKAKWTWQLIKRVLRAAQQGGEKTQEVGLAFHIALRTGMRLQEVLAAPEGLSGRVVTVRTKTHPKGDQIPVGRIAARLIERASFTVEPNEASVLFGKLTRSQMIEGLTFHDARATALTLLSKKVDVMTLARISRHKNLSLLLSTYYRATAEEIADKL